MRVPGEPGRLTLGATHWVLQGLGSEGQKGQDF